MLIVYRHYRRYRLNAVIRRSIEDDQWQEAADALCQLVELFPDDPHTRAELGNAWLKLGRPADAEDAYWSSIEHGSSDPLVFLRLGELLVERGEQQQAVDTLRKSIALGGVSFQAYSQLAGLLIELGDLPEAAEALGHAVLLDPSAASTFRSLGDVSRQLCRSQEAVEAYREARRLGLADASMLLYLGEGLVTGKEWSDAVDALRQSIDLDPTNPWPHHHLGDALCRLGREEEGVAAYTQALLQEPDSFWTLVNLGHAHTHLGHWALATEAFRKAIALDASHAGIQLCLGEALARQYNWGAAADALRAAISLEPENVVAHQLLADCQLELQELNDAAETYRALLSLSPDNVQILEDFGTLLMRLHHWEEAVAVFQRQLAVADGAEASINLGNALAKLERWQEAEEAYEHAKSVSAEIPGLLEALAGVWLKLERWEQAADAYRLCLAERPESAELQRNLGVAVFKLETQKAYYAAHPDAAIRAAAGTLADTRIAGNDWTLERFGPRVTAVETWVNGLLPAPPLSVGNSEVDSDERGPEQRLLFVLDNDFGELTTIMYLLLGQDRIGHFMVLMPDRLYATNSQAFPGRCVSYQSIDDIEQFIDGFEPNITFLCSAYLYVMHELLSPSELVRLVDYLEERDCALVTADPFLGMLSAQSPASLISVDVPGPADLSLPEHVFGHLARVKEEQDEWIAEQLAHAEHVLRHHLHLYPACRDSAGTNRLPERELAFFNERLLCPLLGEVEQDGRPHWVFVLSATDLDTQLMFEATRGFARIVAKLLKDAIEQGRRPVFVGPEKFLRELAVEMDGAEGVELVSFCSFTRLAALLLTAEYAFYWNSVSHSIFLRSFNRLPVILFDRGHLVRNVEAMYERVIDWYYQGEQPVYMKHSEPLSLEALRKATEGFDNVAQRMLEGFRGAPGPEVLVQGILASELSHHYGVDQ